jgi:hypothetical protein
MFEKSTFCVGIALALLVGESQALAEETTSAEPLKMKTSQVVVFKDGYALVVKDVSGKTNDEGRVHTYEVPNSAVLGSFWAVGEKGMPVKSMVAGWEKKRKASSKTINCVSIAALLEANVGRECSFNVGQRAMQGTILKVLANKPEPLSIDQLALVSTRPRTRRPAAATHFILRTKLGDVAVNVSGVHNLTIDDMVSTCKAETVDLEMKKKLTLNFGVKNQDVNFKLIYFRPDVRWIPTYRIELTDKDFKGKSGKAPRKTANIAMQGEILNEAEDFFEVPFHVVVGVPNFRFRSTPSPMVLESEMKLALAQAAPQIMGQQLANQSFSNAMYAQRSGEFRSHRAAGTQSGANLNLPAELNGKASQDLFVYELEPMTLKKGERACVPILTESVGYRDVYTWDLNIKHSESFAQTNADAPSPLILSENKVWRQVELINDTDLPWTTGAAMFVEGMQPLAQELLTYTSPGGICRVPVTVAVDLRGKVDDREIGRDLKAVKWRGYQYAKISGRISAELANNKPYKVPVEVKVRLGGKATKVSNDGKTVLAAFRPEDWANNGDSVNNSSLVTWVSEIEAGECFKPTIDYEFLMRH